MTNIDNEHLDYYKSYRNLENHFLNFIKKTPSFGKCFICLDDKNIKKIITKLKNKNFLTYGINNKSNFKLINVSQGEKFSVFDLVVKLPNKKKKF